MSYYRRSRYSRSPSAYDCYSRSVSRSLSPWSKSSLRGRQRSESVENPGNNLYVTGLSHRITKRDLEKHFSSEGMVEDVNLVVDPWTRESRGFAFVTMSSVEEADRSIKYLDRSVLEGRVITVEKARRRRGRTPTPGKYLGLHTVRARHRTSSNSPYRRSFSRSPRYSSEDDRSRSPSPYYRHRRSRRSRSYSPYDRRRSYSPYVRRRSYSPYVRRRSYSPYDRRRSYSPYDRRRSYSPYYRSRRSYSPYDRRRSYSPYDRRIHYRSHSYSRSPDTRYYSRRRSAYSPYDEQSYSRHHHRSVSRSISPGPRRSSRSYRGYIRRPSQDCYSARSYSRSGSSRSVSRSVTSSSRSVSRSSSPSR